MLAEDGKPWARLMPLEADSPRHGGFAGASAMVAISDPAASVFVSAASAWEIATKHRLGRLPSGAPLRIDFPEALRAPSV